jgi:hypothetical protein
VADPPLLPFQEEGVPLIRHQFNYDLDRSDLSPDFLKGEPDEALIGRRLDALQLGCQGPAFLRGISRRAHGDPTLAGVEVPPESP